ncbi:hypothetical protein D3C79_562290 [compost metagenome]
MHVGLQPLKIGQAGRRVQHQRRDEAVHLIRRFSRPILCLEVRKAIGFEGGDLCK